jgi:hypothetical protein
MRLSGKSTIPLLNSLLFPERVLESGDLHPIRVGIRDRIGRNLDPKYKPRKSQETAALEGYTLASPRWLSTEFFAPSIPVTCSK